MPENPRRRVQVVEKFRFCAAALLRGPAKGQKRRQRVRLRRALRALISARPSEGRGRVPGGRYIGHRWPFAYPQAHRHLGAGQTCPAHATGLLRFRHIFHRQPGGAGFAYAFVGLVQCVGR